MIIGRCEADNLIANSAHPLTAQTVVVKSGEGELKRGSVLMRDSSDKFVMLSSIARTAGATAEVVLARDTDATDVDTVAEVYNSGDFNTNALLVAEGSELTETDVKNLKDAGIYLTESVILSSILPMG